MMREASHETLGQTCNVFLTNPNPSCCGPSGKAQKSTALWGPSENLQTLLYISLLSLPGFAVALLLYKPAKLWYFFFKYYLKLKDLLVCVCQEVIPGPQHKVLPCNGRAELRWWCRTHSQGERGSTV